jgi:hypothetical protein
LSYKSRLSTNNQSDEEPPPPEGVVEPTRTGARKMVPRTALMDALDVSKTKTSVAFAVPNVASSTNVPPLAAWGDSDSCGSPKATPQEKDSPSAKEKPSADDETKPPAKSSGSYADRVKNPSRPGHEKPMVTWAELVAKKSGGEMPSPEIKGMTYLDRQALLKHSEATGELHFPVNFEDQMPRLHLALTAGAAAAGKKIICDGPKMADVVANEIWSLDQNKVATAIARLNSSNDNKKLIESIYSTLDFFQAISFPIPGQIITKNPGIIHASQLLLETYREQVYGIPAKQTRDEMNRNGLRKTFLDQFLSMFPREQDTAKLIFGLAESAAKAVYKVLVKTETIDEDYFQSLKASTEPSVTQLASSFYRRNTRTVTPAHDKKARGPPPKPIETIVISPPIVPCSAQAVASITMPAEIASLKALNELLATCRQEKELKIATEGCGITDRHATIKGIIARSYMVQDTVGAELKCRTTAIKAKCVKAANALIASNGTGVVKDYFDAVMWGSKKDEFFADPKSAGATNFLAAITGMVSSFDARESDSNLTLEEIKDWIMDVGEEYEDAPPEDSD